MLNFFFNYLFFLYKKYTQKQPINKPTKGTSQHGGNWKFKCWKPKLS